MKTNYGYNKYEGAICLVNTDNFEKAGRMITFKIRSILFLLTHIRSFRHKVIVNSNLRKLYKSQPGEIHIIRLTDNFKHIEILSSYPFRTKGIVIIAISKREVHPILLQRTNLILNFKFN